MFIVEIVGPNGTRSYITVNASNSSEARNIANQMAEQGFFGNLSVPADETGIQRLRAESPGFSNVFPANQFTAQSIISSLGAPVSGTGASPATGTGGTGQPTTTTGTTDPVVSPDTEGNQGVGEEALAPSGIRQFRFQQFLRGLEDRGVGTSGLAGLARQRAFRPLQARFLAQQALDEISGAGAGDENPLTFAQFTQRNPLVGRPATDEASALFTRAVNASRGIDPRTGFTSDFSPLQQQFLNPKIAEEAERLGDLALASARGRLGASAEFLPSSDELFARYGAQGNNAISFADFLNQRIFGQSRLG